MVYAFFPKELVREQADLPKEVFVVGPTDVKIPIPVTALDPITARFACKDFEGLLTLLAARDVIRGLQTTMQNDVDSAATVKARMIEWSLAHQIMSPYTSYLAVDERPLTEQNAMGSTGTPTRMVVPCLPPAVDAPPFGYSGFGAGQPRRQLSTYPRMRANTLRYW